MYNFILYNSIKLCKYKVNHELIRFHYIWFFLKSKESFCKNKLFSSLIYDSRLKHSLSLSLHV